MAQFKTEKLNVRFEEMKGLLQEWDDLIVRLTNSPVTEKDLSDILELWRRSGERINIDYLELEYVGEKTEGYGGSRSFFEPRNIDELLDRSRGDRDERAIKMLALHPHTLNFGS